MKDAASKAGRTLTAADKISAVKKIDDMMAADYATYKDGMTADVVAIHAEANKYRQEMMGGPAAPNGPSQRIYYNKVVKNKSLSMGRHGGRK